MSRVLSATILLTLCAVPSLALDRAVVFDFQPVGVDTSDARLAALLLRGRLGDIGAFAMVDPLPETEAWTIEDAAAEAQMLDVQKAITGSFARIGRKLILSYRLIDAASAPALT
jgi:hypothetical protein